MLTLICGLPRAGKTTYSQQYECKVYHLDEFGLLKNAYGRVNNAIGATTADIVVEGIYDKPEQRKVLIETYRGQGARCIWLNTPIEIKRTRRGYSKHCEYPFEPPTYSEGWNEIIIIGDNNGESN